MRLPEAFTQARRSLLLTALLCILLARVAVPSGWMPMAGADGGITLAPCSGMGAMTLTKHDMAGMEMGGMAAHHAAAHDNTDNNPRHPDPGGDHPCSGAGVSVALETPFAVPPPVIANRPVAIGVRAFAVTIGQGLAAPPPPQTGPPRLV